MLEKLGMASYPTNLTDDEWNIVSDLIPETSDPCGRGRPCNWTKRQILNGIFYVVRGGIPWRMMPGDLPCWKTVYHYFRLWAKNGVWKQIHDRLRDKARLAAGKKKPRPLRSSTVKAFALLANPEYVAMMRARKCLEENDILW